MATAQQFVCMRCETLSNVEAFEQTRDGAYYCRCQSCGAKNQVVQTGAPPSRPGLLPVTRLLD